ncbi:Cna B-type domain-containing protein, partial [Listeria seeligeri]
VQLLQNGQTYGNPVKVTKESDWKYSFKDLPKADANNQDYRYSIAEIAVPGYKTTTDGMNLTNTKVTKTTHSTNKLSKTKNLPETGDTNDMLLFSGGLVLLFLGLHLRRKNAKT